MAGVALLTSVSLLTGLAYALPASAADPLPDNPGTRITFGQSARAERCEAGFALHIGGPALKAASMKALNGTDADLAAALYRKANLYPSVLGDALREDRKSSVDYVHASWARTDRWEAANKVYADTGWEADISYHAPEFDADIVAFTLGAQEALYNKFGQDGRSAPGPAAVTAARNLAASISGQDPLGEDAYAKNMLHDSRVSPPFNDTTASDVARFLRLGGFPRQEPAEGSAEYRMEVESLKVSWANCDSWNPVDPRRVLASVTATA